MLKTISPLISPDFLHVLAMMGHGDEIALVDTNFPAHSVAAETTYGHVLSCGANLTETLAAVLPLFPLDQFVPAAAATMQVVGAPEEIPPVVAEITPLIRAEGSAVEAIERFAFYARARAAFAVVQLQERRIYGNLILKKGIIPG